ncbi:M48 family metallopeptidase [Solimonas sp. K1W22B-7]|uniref:M48 family metallopeptidase n=1 Tax=Solimonas sp. K1W22B-7 TaxID=2303331 RepID=UPI001F096BAB|nr:YgjP-like metallopeptidase domain-containing protein [Solimonas sp. K1W22B-7]
MSVEATLRRYLGAYPENLQAQVRQLVEQGRLAGHLAQRYPGRHAIQTDGALHDYVQEYKQAYMKSSPPLHKVQWQNKMDVLQNVLGLHTAISRVQGARLKAKAEIRVSGLFKETAPEFLEMVVVHELAHLREREHNKAFYQLCRHMLPDYHQVEFDLRLLLLQRALASAAVVDP